MVPTCRGAKHVCNHVHAFGEMSRSRGICIGSQATGGELRALMKLRLGRLFLGLGVVSWQTKPLLLCNRAHGWWATRVGAHNLLQTCRLTAGIANPRKSGMSHAMS
jgi:hypothetical protein